MPQHFLYVIPTSDGKKRVRKNLKGFSKVKGVEEWVAEGPVPLPDPPAVNVTPTELSDYLDRLSRKGYVTKRLT